MDQLFDNVWPHIEAGRIKPVIETTVPLPEAARAHAIVASNDTVGKVVLTLS